MEKRVYCAKCGQEQTYRINSVPMVGRIKDEMYSYTGQEARCSTCGERLQVDEINDMNLRLLYDLYRKKKGIISLEHIRAIPVRYAIGKRPLSKLLGWGELTFTRYYEGYMPTRQYSEVLKRLYEDPAFYKEMLERHKELLGSSRSYEKSLKAVEKLLVLSRSREDSKIDRVTRYLLYRCEDITPLMLQKALYYIQGFHYAFLGIFPFEEDCEAWTHGPVFKEIYLRYKDYRYEPEQERKAFDASVFTAGEKVVYDSVINFFCCYSGRVLERITHNEAPWLKARGSLPLSAYSEEIIGKESLGQYFLAVKEKYHMVNPGDIRAYAEDMFSQSCVVPVG
ncbi:type II toxin-antitoxin system antitoxin SocA domain-containing protein [Selenomonas sp. AB3002]|uniref:type II toxin-antitoxin system antitoxin SocA domain-containing protein n=1 Tax=Selenomonas sp. AB3002 TaxID=1392502 RepID=UPI0004970C61